MANNIFVQPGDVLLVRTNPDETVPEYREVTYDDIIDMTRPVKLSHKSRKSSTPEALASRRASLLARAIASGQWSTGALISRDRCVDNLVELLQEVNYYSLSSAARAGIDEMVTAIRNNRALAPLQAKLQPVLSHFGGINA